MLEIRNLTKIYRSKTGEEVRALDNVSISFPESGMVFILGKSGSGKSTLLNVMGGLDSYDEGEFIIKGKSSKDFVGSDFDAYRNTFIGFIFQEYNVLDDFTVGANIGLALELQGKKATDEAINAILEKVELLEYAKRKPNELSGGQKQRVAIARALVKDPEIIMADEPTGALDSNTGKQIFDTLKELSREKLVLIVSHDRDFAERYADRIVELADGKIIEDVTKHEHSSKRVSEGVHAINDHILRIESGYRLTVEDLQMINAYLERNGGDVLLSGDARVNDELRSAAGITKDGSTTVFEGTDPEKDIKAKKYEKDETHFIRSRLPMKNAVKMGASGLKHKKFRLFMTILLSFISFAMFGLSSSMAAYEKINAATDSIIDSKIRSAAVTLSVRHSYYWEGEDEPDHTRVSQGLNDSDIQWLSAQTGLAFVPVFTGYLYADKWNMEGTNISYLMSNYEENEVYTAKLTGFVNMTRDQIPSDYVLTGEWPQTNGEIVLTEFIYRQFKQYGFKDAEGNTISAADLTMEENGEKSIIGKTINIKQIGWNSFNEDSDFEFKVVGILNTNFNYDRYQALMPVDQNQHQQITGEREELSMMEKLLLQELPFELYYGFHALVFTHADDLADMMQHLSLNNMGGPNGDIYQHMSGMNANLSFGIYKPADNDIDDPEWVTGTDCVGTSDAFARVLDNVTWLNAPQSALGEKDVLISMGMLEQILGSVARTVSYSGSTDFTDANVQNELLALLGIQRPANMSAEGAMILYQYLTGSYPFVSYNNMLDVITKMHLVNYVVEKGYHLEANREQSFVKKHLDYSNIKNSEWISKNDAERLQSFLDNSWRYRSESHLIDMSRSWLYTTALTAHLKATGQTMEELATMLEGYMLQLDKNNHGTSDREKFNALEGFRIVGLFMQDAQNSSNFVINDAIHKLWEEWRNISYIEMGKDDYIPQYTEEVAEHEAGKWAFALASIGDGDSAAVQKLVELSYQGEESDLLFEMRNSIMYTLGEFNEVIEILSQVFVYVGLGLALFSSFLLMNFISTSISYKKREIGILRAVGARSSDVFKIFFSEAFIIAIINFVLATAASIAAVIILNSYMRNSGINITLLSFGPIQVALMLAVSIAVALLASFLPVRAIARKKPVDAIKDR